jgi:hypothetical protein
MKQRMISILVGTALCLVAAGARAVIVFEKGKSEPIRGYLVEANSVQVVIREVLPSGETRQRVLQRTDIDDMIVAVSSERLASLQPEAPAAYRDYAEELADKREDPDARATAIRLYLIAARLQPQELGRSCLLGMTALARSPDEERHFRAMAYLLDGEHDRTLLKTPATPSESSVALADSQRSMLRNLLRLLRTRRTREARSMLSRSNVQEALTKVTPVLRPDELSGATDPDGSLSVDLLRKILTVELTLSGARVPDKADSDAERWSQTIARGRTKPVVPLSLATLTEFDPKKCCFRGGQWVEKDAKRY